MRSFILVIILFLSKSVFSESTDTALFYLNSGNLDKSHTEFIRLTKITKNLDTLAKCYHYLGSINYQKSDFVNSLLFFNKSYQIYSDLGHNDKVSNELNNIGLIYMEIGDYDKSKFYLKKSLDLDIKIGNIDNLNATYTNLYVIENLRGNYKMSEYYVSESIKWSLKKGDTLELSKGYSNLGVVMLNTQRYEDALVVFNKSLEISKDSINIAICYNNIGHAYHKIGNINESYIYFNKSIDILKRARSFNYLKDIYNQIHQLEYEKENYKSSLEYYKLYVNIKDSIMSEDNRIVISKMITDYDNKFKTKEREGYITLLEIEENNNRQKIIYLFIIISVVVVSSILISFGFFHSWKNYKLKKKLSEELSIKNNDITDSIKYAMRLQNGILGDVDTFKRNIEKNTKFKSNLLWMPKDIVSGDFYWSYEKNGYKYIAIGDCTGHGVPGSMITIVGHTSLTKIVESGEVDPSVILTKLDRMVKSTFSGIDDINDGMDITLIVIRDYEMFFSGANNFIYVNRSGEMETIKGDKDYVGFGKSIFKTKKVSLLDVDSIHMMTDGIIDQFGGVSDKKLKQSGLKSIIESSKKWGDFERKILTWKGSNDQTDDITYLEIKLK